MQKMGLLLITISLFVVSGCSTKVTKYQQTIDGNAMDFSKIDTMKKGKACLSGWGNSDNSASAAAKNGNISVIKHVEKEWIFSPVWIGTKDCTIVYGE